MYKEISKQFEGHCIVDNVRDESSKNGLTSLQNKILSNLLKTPVVVQNVIDGRNKIKNMLCRSNVLMVLDDVDDLCQLEALAGSHNWYGDGSRIVITTRDENLLTAHKVDVVYPMSLLSDDEAIRLFNRHAYQEKNHLEDYEALSLRVVSYAAGLPLALKILGSFLCDKDENEWQSALAKLRYIPDPKVTDILKISYDGLESFQKELFLDIACFFRGHPKDERMEIFDACGFYSDIGVKVLIQKSLITISDGNFDMHNLVQEMGHHIVRGKHPNNPGKHSRVWREEDIEDLCSSDATTENNNIKAIRFYGESPRFPELVANLKKLRLLICKSILRNNYDTTVFEAPTFLSNELRYIHLSGYLASPLPETFQPKKLVILSLHNSLHEEIWTGNKRLPKLKQLNLYDARNLLSTPDFDGFPCLEKLTISGCPKLEEIHPSIGNHTSLVYVRVDSCDRLRTFPTITQLKKLKIFKILSCKQLFMFPEIQSNMDSLEELSLNDVGMLMMPSSIQQRCTNLTSLELNGYEYLKRNTSKI
ncbi:putative P-loop containing nucleoside triphosphate hydrolase, leucine-rich repeat domain superfamily [Helianthus annuus]|nr:putative P-loop containing nucleoside triphosphate hydrolase, leucine-rich repeat domain superfamily [Helianthus annuus]KAJ0632056.1 putative P-loop containing nucleoside triphosphate hydrolase, leucine-rich repeat domain superfamily [Helianthus annuus]KAJ0635933.1 putative P-loop containing nucleoside triphosphate hydrolase, leucine-rich repeat domain superfamily [Helianthus annuus]KAJ0825865.1 putative P-loop containing nucleoside triphosphate hydrolase, leucine-rich repeat domain superfami